MACSRHTVLSVLWLSLVLRAGTTCLLFGLRPLVCASRLPLQRPGPKGHGPKAKGRGRDRVRRPGAGQRRRRLRDGRQRRDVGRSKSKTSPRSTTWVCSLVVPARTEGPWAGTTCLLFCLFLVCFLVCVGLSPLRLRLLPGQGRERNGAVREFGERAGQRLVRGNGRQRRDEGRSESKTSPSRRPPKAVRRPARRLGNVLFLLCCVAHFDCLFGGYFLC